MQFSNVIDVVIPEGNCSKIIETDTDKVLWSNPNLPTLINNKGDMLYLTVYKSDSFKLSDYLNNVTDTGNTTYNAYYTFSKEQEKSIPNVKEYRFYITTDSSPRRKVTIVQHNTGAVSRGCSMDCVLWTNGEFECDVISSYNVSKSTGFAGILHIDCKTKYGIFTFRVRINFYPYPTWYYE